MGLRASNFSCWEDTFAVHFLFIQLVCAIGTNYLNGGEGQSLLIPRTTFLAREAKWHISAPFMRCHLYCLTNRQNNDMAKRQAKFSKNCTSRRKEMYPALFFIKLERWKVTLGYIYCGSHDVKSKELLTLFTLSSSDLQSSNWCS